jgi:rod shape-determining protein MreC
VPRSRSARVAVLGTAQRRTPAPPPNRTNAAVRRRIVATGLVLVSLLLLTIYVRESQGGGLHGIQSTGAAVLKPFEVAANRIARPFRDTAGWFGDVLHAKSKAAKLQRENDDLRRNQVQYAAAAHENRVLRKLLRYESGKRFPEDYRPVNAEVINRPPSEFQQQVGISAGSDSGVRLHDPVVTPDGLVGQVTAVARSTAEVTLLTDESSAVSALDVRTRAGGIVQLGPTGETNFDRVTKDQVVQRGDIVITAGWRSKRFASIYPRGIPVCRVTSWSQKDTDLYKQIQCEPYADFSNLEAVVVLVPKSR